ncbi:hypothetical protein EX30DRAFT_342407 [Ascodesmis nigricans]|uniref:Uncharacterized protein n=1 Tax=Ascodesmis nigricans TaxID=341454 RepID=A0A4S2MST0_9PEZI|nr:hypothetical protein EX30DRAFT_342407 [Ascodesmis nigricans]
MGHRQSVPCVIDDEVTQRATETTRTIVKSSKPKRQNKLQKPPGPGDHPISGKARRLSTLDFRSKPALDNNSSLASLASSTAPLPAAAPLPTPPNSRKSPNVSGQISRRPTIKSSCVAAEDGSDELSSTAPADDPVSLLRRRSLLNAAPPATATRRSEPLRSRRNTLPAQPLDRVVEIDIQRSNTPSAISVIGAFKRGSLRITNGCASPAPSSAPTSPAMKPVTVRRSMDSIVCQGPRNSWEATQTTIQVMVQDPDTGELRPEEYVHEQISTLEKPILPAPDPAAVTTTQNPKYHKHMSSAPINSHNHNSQDNAASHPFTIRHVHDETFDILEGRTRVPTCTVQYSDSTFKPYAPESIPSDYPLKLFPEKSNFHKPNQSFPRYDGPPEHIYTFEESVVTRREIPYPVPVDGEGERNYSSHNSSRDRSLKQSHSVSHLPVVNGIDCSGSFQLQTPTPPVMQFVQMQNLPPNSRITGQEYYQRFSRRRSQMKSRESMNGVHT